MNAVDLLGWAGAALLAAYVIPVDLLRRWTLRLLGNALLFAYAVLGHIWPLVLSSVAMIAHLLVKRLRLESADEPATSFAVIEVGPQDEYLRHVLRVHGADILQYQPGFVWDGAAPGRQAALLLHGAETIGVLLYEEPEPDVADLILDYVTPRYRNLGPGAHVFSPGGFFAAQGFRLVRTPPGMREAYYDRMGFERDGDRFVYRVR